MLDLVTGAWKALGKCARWLQVARECCRKGFRGMLVMVQQKWMQKTSGKG